MAYAYIIVIYVTYIQIYCYCLLGHGLPKDLWREIFVHKDFLSYFKIYEPVHDKTNKMDQNMDFCALQFFDIIDNAL